MAGQLRLLSCRWLSHCTWPLTTISWRLGSGPENDISWSLPGIRRVIGLAILPEGKGLGSKEPRGGGRGLGRPVPPLREQLAGCRGTGMGVTAVFWLVQAVLIMGGGCSTL